LKFAHIADIHIRNSSRFSEYREVFNKLYISLKNDSIDIIFIVGDLFHSKTRLSPESIRLAVEFLNELSSIAKVIIIPGNHDINLSNVERLDAITPLIEAMEQKILSFNEDINIYKNDYRIFYLRNSGNYKLYITSDRFYTVGHYGLIDQDKWIDVNNKNEIALYHGIIEGSRNDVGYLFKDDGIQVSRFKNHKVVMLGDIHKAQSFDSNVYFPGSLITQNFGECIEKGYLIWDLKDDLKINSVDFQQIKNDYAFYTIMVKEDGSFPTCSEIPNKAIVRVFVKKDRITPFEEGELRKRITDKFHPSEIRNVQAIGETGQIKSFNEVNVSIDSEDINDVGTQEKYINDFFKDKTDSFTIKKILDLHNDVRTKLPMEEIMVRNTEWNINEVEIHNIGCFKEGNRINFDKMKGIIGIIAPNKSGKTTLIDAINFALFKTTPHSSMNIGDVINSRKNVGRAEVIISINDRKYRIDRTIKRWSNPGKPDGFSASINFEQIDNFGNRIEDLRGDLKWDTDKEIRKLLGTYEDFKLTSYSQQNQNLDFIDDVRGTERKKILTRFLNLDICLKLGEIAKKEFDLIKSKLHGEDVKQLEMLVDTLTDEIEEIDKNVEFQRERTSKLKTAHTEIIEKIITIKSSLGEEKFNFKSKNELTKKLKRIETDISKKNDEIQSIEKELSVLIDIRDTRNEIKGKISEKEDDLKKKKELQERETNYKGKLEQLNRELKNNCRQTEIFKDQNWCRNEKCIFLKDALKAEESIPKFNEIIEKVQALILTIQTDLIKYTSIDKEIKTLNLEITEIEKLIVRKKFLEEKIITIKEIIDKLNEEYKETEKELNDLKNKEELIKEKQKMEEVLNSNIELKTQIENRLSVQEKLLNDLLLDKREKETRKSITIENISKLKQYSEDYKIYEFYLDAMAVSGIPLQVIRKTLPIINAEISNILFPVDFTIKLQMDENDKEIEMIISDNHSSRKLESASGMEKMVSSLAIRVALSSISSLPTSDILFIDEGFGVLDTDHIGSIGKLLEHLKSIYKTIVIISHIDAILDVCDHHIGIEKDNEENSMLVMPN